MKRILLLLGFLLLPTGFISPAIAQIQAGRLMLGVQGSTYKYWGDFTDDQYGWGGEGLLRYDFLPWMGLQLSGGVGSTCYRINPSDMAALPDYFKGRTYGQNYTGTFTRIDEMNEIRFSHYELNALFHLFPSRSFVPQIHAGIGVLNHYPTNHSQHEPLPNIINESYNRYSLIFPVGFGFEYFLSDDVSINAKANFRITTSDNLDDVALENSENDYFATIGAGFNFYLSGDLDSDNDGISNGDEKRLGLDPRRADSDGDGLSDYEEMNIYFTDPKRADSDNDGLLDGEEIKFKSSPIKADTDGDGLMDFEEFVRGSNPLDIDSDKDGLLDGDEVKKYNSDPAKADADGDGLKDGEEVKMGTDPRRFDTDGDGLSDGTEVLEAQTNPLKIDTDGDGLSDAEEYTVQKTDPHNPDTDGDMLMDGEEVIRYKTNPKVMDTDMDGWSDGEEVLRRCTNPTNPDTDGDGMIDPKDTDPCANSCCCCNKKQEPPPVPKLDEPKKDTPVKQAKPKRNFSIRFLRNTDQIDNTDPETQRSIKELREYLASECDKLRVTFEGHTSAEGNPSRNKVLSDMRARAVKQLMIQQGIAAEKIQGTTGMGASMPLVPEPSKAEARRMRKDELESVRKQNRRISVREDIPCEP